MLTKLVIKIRCLQDLLGSCKQQNLYSRIVIKLICRHKVGVLCKQNLWKTFYKGGGINKVDFFDYYKETEKGFGIVIKEVVKFDVEKDPIEFIENFTAPQSYVYLEREKRKLA